MMLPPSTVDSAEDFDWKELFGDTSPYAGMPMSYPPEQFTVPLSPVLTDKQSPLKPSVQFDDHVTRPPMVSLPITPQIAMRSPSTEFIPSPATSNSSYRPSPKIKVEQQLFAPSNPLPRRRGPGRPSKAQLALEGTQRKRGRLSVTLRREIHNDSAMRSRAKFNNALENLWNELPEHIQLEALGRDLCRQIPRAEKVEIMISYIRKLEAYNTSGLL